MCDVSMTYRFRMHMAYAWRALPYHGVHAALPYFVFITKTCLCNIQ